MFRRGDLVLDIGAGTGLMAEWYLHRGARVVAVEPEQCDFDGLRAKIGDHSRAVLLREALGERIEANKRLHIYPGASTISTFVPEVHWSDISAFAGTKPLSYEEVEVTTLDALIARYGWPQFVKVDVEGYEPWVFRGLSRPVPFVQFEFAGWTFRADHIHQCVARILEIAPRAMFNYTVDESPAFEMSDADQGHLPAHLRWSWYSAEEVLAELAHQIGKDPLYWGNVFANMRQNCDRRKLARRRRFRKRRYRPPACVLRGAGVQHRH
jgi:FkbM family methyltransferase